MASENIFHEIDSILSEMERTDKATRMGWLMGEKMRLNRLANELALYSIRNGGLTTSEKAYAGQLLDMISLVESQAAELNREISNDIRKEITKAILGY